MKFDVYSDDSIGFKFEAGDIVRTTREIRERSSFFPKVSSLLFGKNELAKVTKTNKKSFFLFSGNHYEGIWLYYTDDAVLPMTHSIPEQYLPWLNETYQEYNKWHSDPLFLRKPLT